MSEASKRQEGGDHYKKNKIQPWDVIEAWGLDYWLGNLVKYIFRASTAAKESPELNLRKGAHYLQKKLELMQASISVGTPVGYTQREGGERYPVSAELARLLTPEFFSRRDPVFLQAVCKTPSMWYEVHSVEFSDGRVWDCVNGWRS